MLGESSSLKLVGVSVGPAASNAWANGSGVGVKKKCDTTLQGGASKRRQ